MRKQNVQVSNWMSIEHLSMVTERTYNLLKYLLEFPQE